MQKENPNWIGKWDMVYTNSLDHVTDFHGTLQTIYDQLTILGLFILDYTIWRDNSIKPSISDALDVSYKELKRGLRVADFEVIQENQYYKNRYQQNDEKIDSYYFICQK